MLQGDQIDKQIRPKNSQESLDKDCITLHECKTLHVYIKSFQLGSRRSKKIPAIIIWFQVQIALILLV